MKKKIRIILAVIACIIVALVGYSAYEVHQSAQEFQKAYESKKSFERTETDEAEADGEKKTEEQSGERPYGVLEPGSEYEVDIYIDNRDNSNRLYIYDEAKEVMDQMLDRLLFLPFRCPAIIGPPLTKIVGMFSRAAAIKSPGTFLSQLGIITRPSN